jgi:hypothetical protein
MFVFQKDVNGRLEPHRIVGREEKPVLVDIHHVADPLFIKVELAQPVFDRRLDVASVYRTRKIRQSDFPVQRGSNALLAMC